MQRAITFSSAYISFFVTKYLIGVSEVFCCCAVGFIVQLRFPVQAGMGSCRVDRNTLIFLLTELIIGNRAVQRTTCIFAAIARFFLITTSFPLSGQRNSIKEALCFYSNKCLVRIDSWCPTRARLFVSLLVWGFAATI